MTGDWAWAAFMRRCMGGMLPLGSRNAGQDLVAAFALAAVAIPEQTATARLAGLTAGVVALLLELCVSGGIGFPAVAGPLWVAVALAINAARPQESAWASQLKPLVAVPLPFFVALTFWYGLTVWHPVTRADALMRVAGIRNRDLKPGNILMTPGGEPRIIDFDSAICRLAEPLTRPSAGEIRVTRPTTKRSSMTSPTTSTGKPAKRPTRSRARPPSIGGSVVIRRADARRRRAG